MSDSSEADVRRFWDVAKVRAKFTTLPGYLPSSSLEMVQPPAWSFGRTPELADELLDLVLAGTKTATASALSEYGDDEPLPEPGSLGIVLDGAGTPRVLIATTEVHVVPFEAVDEVHARLEGEGDLTLEHWREVHERAFSSGGSFALDMPVVLERFTVLYQR